MRDNEGPKNRRKGSVHYLVIILVSGTKPGRKGEKDKQGRSKTYR